MANWSLPTVLDLYTDVITYFRSRDEDCATMFDVGTPTNIPTDAVKWSSANNRFELWSGSAWGALSSKYLIDVDTVDGLHAASFLRKDIADTASNNLTFSGIANFSGTLQVNGATVSATATEINSSCDGSTAAISTVLVDTDNFVCNDDGTMKQVSLADLVSFITLAAHPVGEIYSSTVNISPATLFGGTWESIRGKTIFAEDGTSGYIAGETGGSKDSIVVSHTHTGDSHSHGMSHTHTVPSSALAVSGGGSYLAHSTGPGAQVVTRTSSAASTAFDGGGNTSTPSPNGGTGANSNMQPYLATFMWQRTL